MTVWLRFAFRISKDTRAQAHDRAWPRLCIRVRSLAHTKTHTHKSTSTHPHTRAQTHRQTRTHRPICNTYCFSTATMVQWTRLIRKLYAHCLYCYFSNLAVPRCSYFAKLVCGAWFHYLILPFVPVLLFTRRILLSVIAYVMICI